MQTIKEFFKMIWIIFLYLVAGAIMGLISIVIMARFSS
jgi:hypothetical protein